VSQPLDRRPLTQPHPRRLDPAHLRRAEILAAHAKALERGEAGYLDPASGLFVLTAQYLADRGTCCGQGCRHCPYLRTGPDSFVGVGERGGDHTAQHSQAGGVTGVGQHQDGGDDPVLGDAG
jgi:hypothetical protein